MPKTIGQTQLCSAGLGSACSFELQGDAIIVRLFGLFTIKTIHLAAVAYLRLATRDEVTPLYFMVHWPQFLPHRRSARPVYVLQTRKRTRVFIKLQGDAHFKLRQAIGRFQTRSKRRMAA